MQRTLLIFEFELLEIFFTLHSLGLSSFTTALPFFQGVSLPAYPLSSFYLLFFVLARAERGYIADQPELSVPTWASAHSSKAIPDTVFEVREAARTRSSAGSNV